MGTPHILHESNDDDDDDVDDDDDDDDDDDKDDEDDDDIDDDKDDDDDDEDDDDDDEDEDDDDKDDDKDDDDDDDDVEDDDDKNDDKVDDDDDDDGSTTTLDHRIRALPLTNDPESWDCIFFSFPGLSREPGTHHAIFVFCWTQRRRKDDCRMVCAHQRRSSSVDFTNATVVGPIRKTNRSNNCCMVCAGQIHLSHQPTGHRPTTVKHFRDA